MNRTTDPPECCPVCGRGANYGIGITVPRIFVCSNGHRWTEGTGHAS
jgi:hypothetical protein